MLVNLLPSLVIAKDGPKCLVLYCLFQDASIFVAIHHLATHKLITDELNWFSITCKADVPNQKLIITLYQKNTSVESLTLSMLPYHTFRIDGVHDATFASTDSAIFSILYEKFFTIFELLPKRCKHIETWTSQSVEHHCVVALYTVSFSFEYIQLGTDFGDIQIESKNTAYIPIFNMKIVT